MSIQPRVCGDYLRRFLHRSHHVDTTPRVRGLQVDASVQITVYRYNPACAGTTRMASSSTMCPTIQPRVCGDYGSFVMRPIMIADTTPRVRGLRERLLQIERCHRYNPACAGTTTQQSRRVGHSTIQPRVCGDYMCSVPPVSRPDDTTPRVRGLRAVDRARAAITRYNPACAGTTRLRRCRA